MSARKWIDQPSGLQPLHSMNGKRVIAPDGAPPLLGCVTVYFISGDTISAFIPKLCLSDGWPKGTKP